MPDPMCCTMLRGQVSAVAADRPKSTAVVVNSVAERPTGLRRNELAQVRAQRCGQPAEAAQDKDTLCGGLTQTTDSVFRCAVLPQAAIERENHVSQEAGIGASNAASQRFTRAVLLDSGIGEHRCQDCQDDLRQLATNAAEEEQRAGLDNQRRNAPAAADEV
eukprot:6193387-Pleurochrysis_carterae.AAC.5